MRTSICLALLASASVCFAAAPEPGLLFFLSGDKGFTADYAAGDPEPNFLANVKIIPDGARGKGFECANMQELAYWAPGNIYAQRGTLAFSWRSRYPVGPTAFPIFRVGYADHSSWDMVWLRIDYNGEGGFDAFVTDINLSRITLTAWGVDPGKWEVVQGVDTKGVVTKGEDAADSALSTPTVDLERSTDPELTLPPRATTVITLKLVSKGTPYWDRPDLGIGKEDVKVQGQQVRVTVHSLGSVDTPATTVALVDKSGKVLATVPVPALKAPLDLFPKTTTVTLTVPKGAAIAGGSVVVDPAATLKEITRMNNRVAL